MSEHHHHTDPSGTATVVLDLGGDTGALIIYTGPERCGQEIEVSPAEGTDRARTHAAVRARHVRPHPVYGVLIPALKAGRYTVWRDADTPLTTVDVVGGAVTEYHWPAAG